MASDLTLSRDGILASIARLQLRLNVELRRVAASPATLQQKNSVRDLTHELTLRLNEASADVDTSGDPAPVWNGWVHDSIAPRLQTLSVLLNQVLGDPLGVCTYDEGQFCSTQAECDLPNSSWSQGGCP